jgi:hypothetical protein
MDEALIDEMSGVVQEIHSPTPREAAIVVDRPWESPHFGYVTVFRTGTGSGCTTAP